MGVLDGLPAGLRGWLGELDPATLEAFRELDETYVPVGSYVFPDDTALGMRARKWRDAEWRTMGLWTQLRLRATDGSPLAQSAPMAVARRRLRWTPQELRLLWATTLGAPESRRRTDLLYRIPVSTVQHLPPSEREPVLALLRQAQRELDGTPYASSWQAKRVLDGLLTEHPTGDPADAARSLVPEGDAFAALVREEYGRRLGDPASLPLARQSLPLARHWVTAKTGNPSAKWTARAAELLTPGAAVLIKDVLGRLPAHRETVVLQRYGGYERRVVTYLDERTAVLLRGMLWTLDLVDEPWVVPLLGDIALAAGTGVGGSGADSRSELVANAAIGGLARRGGLEVVAHLARVQAKVRKKSILSRVSRTLDAVAERTGLSPEQLLERTVPTFGLGPDGARTEHGLRLSLDGTITYGTRKTVPKAVREAHKELLAELRATAKELRKTLPAERFRVERALATGRVWEWHEVCAFYLDHPVTGAFGRALIWQVAGGPAGLPVRAGDAWELAGPDGGRVRPGPDAAVTLWHPIAHTAEEVRAWRDHLMASGLRQPFKQAFREVYLLTPAEEETHDHSLRFANHLLRYGQAKALLTGRGWTGLSLGHWDAAGGSGQAEAVRELPGGLRATWSFFLDEHSFERDGYGVTASVCVSDALRFLPAGGRPVPLREVPPLVLSETLRDADLAVGVTSTGLDPAGHGAYWESYGFGDLGESARVRRDAVARLLPRLSIADRCELSDRFLVVRGDLRTYKIHLGSGNILMEPNDAYLCIVPGPGRDQVFLPFEENGGLLSVILSKAFLLAADSAIGDPTITRQIRG